jgi:methionyl aminopeptidase
MIPIKTEKEIEILKVSGQILAQVMSKVIKSVRPGVKTKDLDQLAERLIIANKARPSFKMVPNYFWTTCININDGLVHGIPGDYQVGKGDLVTIDLGVYYRGFHTDMARTFQVQVDNEKRIAKRGEKAEFIEIGKSALRKAIATARPGNRVGHISQAIQETIEGVSYRCSRNFTGHGVGRSLHEEPRIPCVLDREIKNTPQLKSGMVLAIEVIYTQGKPEVVISDDGWTVTTVDGQLGGLFENTVAVTKAGPKVLTMI